MATAAAETVGARLAGERPGRMRALVTASAVGLAAATLTYKLLRSGGDGES